MEAKKSQDQQPRHVARERSYIVNVGVLEAVTAHPVITAYGEIKSWRSLVLRAPVAGEVIEIAAEFRNGTPVAAGSTLFIVDPEDYRSRREDAVAALADVLTEKAEADEALILSSQEREAARKQRQLQQKELERQRKLFERGLATESNVSAAELAFSGAEQTHISRSQSLVAATKRAERAELKIQRARISLSEAERDLGETRVSASFDGVLSGVSLELGQRLASNEQVATLVDPAALEAVFRVSNNKFGRLLDTEGQLLNQPVTVSLQLGDIEVGIPGFVSRVDAVVSQGQSGRLIYARLETGSRTVLRPGDFVTVSIQEPPLHEVSVIPATAATDDGRILLVTDEERLRETAVEILRRNGDQLFVRPATFGDRYVHERLPQLASGVKVRSAGSKPPAGQADEDYITLDKMRRDALVAFVTANRRMPDDKKEDLLESLSAPRVPRSVVERIESRMGSK